MRSTRRFTWLLAAAFTGIAVASATGNPGDAETHLLAAAKADDAAQVRMLLARHAHADAAQGDGFTALHWAAYNDDPAMAALLLRSGAPIDARTRLEGVTPLVLAAGTGDVELVRVLLRAGAKVDNANDNGTTALMQAAAAGETKVVRELLDHGAAVNAREKTYGQNALFFAASHDRGDAIKLLVERGAMTSARTVVLKRERVSVGTDGAEVPEAKKSENVGRTQSEAVSAKAAGEKEATVSAKHSGLDDGGLKALADKKSEAPESGATPVTVDVKEGIPGHGGKDGLGGEAAKLAGMSKKDMPDAYGFNAEERKNRVYGALTLGGMTALHVAARDGQMESVHALLDAGADVNARTDTDMATPLLLALVNGHYDVAAYLVQRKADVKLLSSDGLGPLYALIDVQWAPHTWYPQPVTAQEKTGYLDLLQTLLELHADVNVRLTRKLWFRGFANDETWVDATLSTPFWRAALAGDLRAMRLLAQYGADTNAPSKSNDTPMMVAAGLGWAAYWTSNAPDSRLDAVKFCLDHGAAINAVDAKGYRAIHGAAFRGDDDMLHYLLATGADLDVSSKLGDTVADAANGLFEHAVVHPETVAMLETLGSKSSNNCRSNECVVPAKKDVPVKAGAGSKAAVGKADQQVKEP